MNDQRADSLPEAEAKQLLLEVLQSIDRNADSSYPTPLERRGDLAEQVVLGLDAKARGLFRSIVILLSHDQAEEAAVLCRSLFYDSLLLVYFFQNLAHAEQLAVRFMHSSILGERGLIHGREAAGAPPSGRGLEGNAEDLADLQAYARSIGMMGKIKRLPDEKTIATEIGNPNYYYFYQWASVYVHTTRTGLDARLFHGADGLVVRFTTTDLRTWVGVGVFAGELFASGHAAACFLLGFDTAEDVEAFRRHAHDRLRDVAVRSNVPGGEQLFDERS